MHTAKNKTNGASPGTLQESQYGEPYHYLPEAGETGFRQHRFWSWGLRYLGRLEVVLDLLRDIAFDSLLDVGCGDGRFLREVDRAFEDKNLCGIDRSGRAIELARSSNPGADYRCIDIRQLPANASWDAATLLEVLEHIPPADLPDFIAEVAERLEPGGALILTVPHVNQKLPEKHYQHFDERGLTALLSDRFEVERVILFDAIGWRMRLLWKLMGGSGRYFVVTHQAMNNFYYDYYFRHCLAGASPQNAERIAVVAYRR